jgi:hypothetical protein
LSWRASPCKAMPRQHPLEGVETLSLIKEHLRPPAAKVLHGYKPVPTCENGGLVEGSWISGDGSGIFDARQNLPRGMIVEEGVIKLLRVAL